MSKVEVDQVDPQSGTTLTLGTSGDTVSIPSGVTLANSGTMTGVPVPTTGIAASAISSGTIATARLGSGTASSSTFLRGDQTYAEAGGGSLVKLASTTISSGVAAVSFNSTYINSTYDNYRVIAYGLSTAADNQDIALRMSVDNGSNFATHVGCMNYTQINHNGVAQATVGNRTSITMGSDEEADAGGGTNFIIDLMNLNSTAQYKFGNGLGTTVNQNGSYYAYRVHGYIQSNTAVNFFKIFTEAGGNLDGGTVTLYGYEK